MAFAAGYQAAVAALVPELAGRTACLCVSEAGGNHPRAIEARVHDGRVTGTKCWSTLADRADVLLVAASEGRDGDRNRVRLVAIEVPSPAARLRPMPPTPFTPEIGHFELALVDAVGTPLPGDGYARWIKPFRTVEDIHVGAAATAMLLRASRWNGWPTGLSERLCAQVLGWRALGSADPTAPTTHLALAGALAELQRVAVEVEALPADPEFAARWRRDAPILGVAGRARARRTEAAWRKLQLPLNLPGA
jgi:hypothetical protein